MVRECYFGNNCQTAKAKKRIKGAVFAGWVLAFLTIVNVGFPWFVLSPATTISFSFHSDVPGVSRGYFSIFGLGPIILLNLLTVVIIVGLTIGIHRKNELCAILLFAYEVVALIVNLPPAIHFFGIPFLVVAVILVFLADGMIGTFDYHKLKAKEIGVE